MLSRWWRWGKGGTLRERSRRARSSHHSLTTKTLMGDVGGCACDFDDEIAESNFADKVKIIQSHSLFYGYEYCDEYCYCDCDECCYDFVEKSLLV